MYNMKQYLTCLHIILLISAWFTCLPSITTYFTNITEIRWLSKSSRHCRSGILYYG